MLVIEGAVVTIDAMGCQREVAQKIIDKKADYLLALKGNQGTLHDDVEIFAVEQKAKQMLAEKAAKQAQNTVEGKDEPANEPTEEGKKITKREDAWDGQVHYYEKTVTFVQTVQAKTKAKTNLLGKVEFMVCDDELCLPPAEFTFKIPLSN